jgi:hypothetical protein
MLAVATVAVALWGLRWLISLGPDLTVWTLSTILWVALLFCLPIGEPPSSPPGPE